MKNKEIDLSKYIMGFLQENFVFSTNPIEEDLKQAEVEDKILVAYSKDLKKCVEFGERLGESAYLSIWLDQSPIKMKDGKELDFEEFFLIHYLEMMKKEMSRMHNRD